jgi:hypothetical protein
VKLTIPDPQQVSVTPPEFVDALVFGLSGTGKTEFAASWSLAGPVLFLDSDNGILSVATSPRLTSTQRDLIFQVPITDKSQDSHYKKPVGFLSVKTILEQVSTNGEFAGIVPKTIVIDSLTTLSEMCMAYVLTNNSKSANAQPTLPDYGTQMRELLNIVHLGVGSRANFICIAHQQFTKDELSGRIWCVPLVTGKLSQNLPAYFDEVYYARVRQSGNSHKYTLLTKPDGMIVAKSRLGLPAEIDSSYVSIKTILEGLQTRAKQTFQNQKGGGGPTAAAKALNINP